MTPAASSLSAQRASGCSPGAASYRLSGHGQRAPALSVRSSQSLQSEGALASIPTPITVCRSQLLPREERLPSHQCFHILIIDQ